MHEVKKRDTACRFAAAFDEMRCVPVNLRFYPPPEA
jgi:hypothetical protein